jgi:hypothetical protein
MHCKDESALAEGPNPQSGQSLTEALILIPVALVITSCIITLLAAYGWNGSHTNAALFIRLGTLPAASLATQQQEALARLDSIKAAALSASPLQQRQLPLQSLNSRSTDCATPKSNKKSNDSAGHLDFCLQRDGHLEGKPSSNQPLAAHSQEMGQLLRSNPMLSAPTHRVFDNWQGFPRHQRSQWHSTVHQKTKHQHRHREFHRRVAAGGTESPQAPFNLTRDCLYSAQGWGCKGEHSRLRSDIHRLFREQRMRSAAVQIAACAAESCSQAPHPILCAATAANTLREAALGQEPSMCPISATTLKAIYRSSIQMLQILQGSEFLASRKGSSASTLVDSVRPML